MTDFTKHDAPGPLSGYLYQVLSALLLLLETKNPDAQICVEQFDDVAFVENDAPQIMIQTKHQLNRVGNLNNTSVDLWRTINSWCDAIKTETITDDTNFLIVTTAIAQSDTAAYFLKKSHRDYQKAYALLSETAKTHNGKTNKRFYENYLSLKVEDQEKLIKNIIIYDESSSIANIKNDIMPYIRTATLPDFEEKVYDKVIGWWIQNIIKCLISIDPVFINYRQLQNALFDAGSEYKSDSLPIDVDPLYQPTDDELNSLSPENRIFIEQLKLISISNLRLKRCIRDYYNAYKQRSSWVRENLLFIDDLTKYEEILIDEWERLFLIMKEEIDDYGNTITDDIKSKKGKKFFEGIEELDIPIKENVTRPFIMRGAFHELSNQLKVGWHVDFYERLCHLLRV